MPGMNQIWNDYQRNSRENRVKEYGYDPLEPMLPIQQAMLLLAKQPGALFLGQGVAYPGVATYKDLTGVPEHQRIELPVVEELQLGIGIGLSLQGFLPILIYPRIDFMLRAMDQLVNHLDKLEQMSCGQFCPKVIIKTRVGPKAPLNAGPQHTQNHTEAMRSMLTEIDVVELIEPEQIETVYNIALYRPDSKSTLIIEHIEYYTSK